MSGHRKKPAKSTNGAAEHATCSQKTKSAKAGLQFPVGRIHRLLRQGQYAERIAVGAAVYLSGVLEYVTAEVLELSGDAASSNKKQRIGPRHIQLAVRNDTELNQLFANVTIAEGGVPPNILPQLLPQKSELPKEVVKDV
ncbi:histone H2A-beta, sperm-like [Sphaerodactylus townsendi]|uniref:histone H2A-beta, sperm-like n=1 Tax=Sphaerodactylus townsendi TaxID=933632 RepID=UPI002025C3F4|nr:histone H2A-beta, sperm-like [Sphaerodactylus townsendi]